MATYISLTITSIANGFLVQTHDGESHIADKQPDPLYYSSFDAAVDSLAAHAREIVALQAIREEHEKAEDYRAAFSGAAQGLQQADSTALNRREYWGEPGRSKPTHYDPLGQRPPALSPNARAAFTIGSAQRDYGDESTAE